MSLLVCMYEDVCVWDGGVRRRRKRVGCAYGWTRMMFVYLFVCLFV